MTEYGPWTFTWDGENRLIVVASNSVPMVQNAYVYIHRRIMKITATATNTCLYDGWNLLAERNASYTNHYVWGLDLSQSREGAGGIGGLLMAVLDGTAYYPAYDANGNVTDYTDAIGSTVARYEYDPFGKVSTQSGSLADIFAYQFSTKYADDETGLVYYGYRFYSPGMGRWINRDPIGMLGGVNVNSFTFNDLLNTQDKLGLTTGCCNGKKLTWMDQCCRDAGEYICGNANQCCGGDCIIDTVNKCCKDGSIIDKISFWENRGYSDYWNCVFTRAGNPPGPDNCDFQYPSAQCALYLSAVLASQVECRRKVCPSNEPGHPLLP
jgi:RHS repeat-associated protein